MFVGRGVGSDGLAAINIVLDYLFVFPLGRGIGGATLATTLGCAVGGGMVGWYFLKRTRTLKLYRLKLSQTSLRLTARNVGYMTRLGASAFLTKLAMSPMILTGNYVFLRLLGENGVAAGCVRGSTDVGDHRSGFLVEKEVGIARNSVFSFI